MLSSVLGEHSLCCASLPAVRVTSAAFTSVPCLAAHYKPSSVHNYKLAAETYTRDRVHKSLFPSLAAATLNVS